MTSFHNKHITKNYIELSQIQSQVQLTENQDDLQKEMHQREMKVQELREAVDVHKVS